MAYTVAVMLDGMTPRTLPTGITMASHSRMLPRSSPTMSSALRSSTSSIPGAGDRFITIGPIQHGLVMVVWTERVDDTIRIISARWATKRAVERYRTYLDHLR